MVAETTPIGHRLLQSLSAIRHEAILLMSPDARHGHNPVTSKRWPVLEGNFTIRNGACGNALDEGLYLSEVLYKMLATQEGIILEIMPV